MLNFRKIADQSNLEQRSKVLVVIFLSRPLEMTAELLAETATLQELLVLGILLQNFLVAGEFEDRLASWCGTVEKVEDAGWLAWGRLEPADMRS